MDSKNEILSGGNQNQVIKVDGTVHRKVSGHPMLHSYLQYLERTGMPGVPRFLGVDEQGHEILTYLPGKTMGPDYSPAHPCLTSDETLTDAARFMRRLHDVSAGFLPEAVGGGWKNPYFPEEPCETICHGDAAVWNFVFENDRFAGLFDFDQAYPGTRVWDLCSTLFSLIPLTYFVYLPETRTAVEYLPSEHSAERRRRVRLFFDSYGIECPANISGLVAQRIQLDFCDSLINGAASGDENCARMIKEGHLTHYQKVVAHLRAHGREWE